MDKIPYQKWHREIRNQENQHRQKEIKQQRIVENRANISVIPFAIPPCNHYLRSLAETKSDKINGDVKHTADGRCTQSYFAHASEKSCVRYIDYVLGNQRKKNRVGNLKYFFVGVHVPPFPSGFPPQGEKLAIKFE